MRKPNRPYLTLFAAAALLALGTGCSYLKFPGVYRITIQQGNVVTQEMVDQLEMGMTKRQVRYVLGTPLIDDPFNHDRWDYYYSFVNPRGKTYQRSLYALFENDQLTHVHVSDEYTLPENLQPKLKTPPSNKPNEMKEMGEEAQDSIAAGK
ncbi:outer membrane protein assembly factor BamE [Marinibactrum halimedae]|uniref:Outer membrane protein assembly factor BamE n=1 Tax=Marinibactrum halimedae TaxID=1444977 RepID=A0AA37T6U2_9GAMM|nr:outer membrane protein assembly factor BamE [Marinibactrum halimedae]MCD9459019.1 outer membrane protein assembly factor BamE [Marinibactrum halimedae]GLS26851.1 outer membrane protein assembly factor BamE [Marinibactrum halimedae]